MSMISKVHALEMRVGLPTIKKQSLIQDSAFVVTLPLDYFFA